MLRLHTRRFKGSGKTSPYYGGSLNLDEHLRAGETGARNQRARRKIVAENFLPQFGEAIAVASVGDEHRHRHHIGEAAAGLLESLVQAGKHLSDLAVEIAGKRVSRSVRRSNLPGEPDDPPAFGDHRL